MGKLDDNIHEMKRWTEKEEIKKMIDVVGDLLKAENHFNYEANIECGDIEEETLDISEYSYGEHYEVITGTFNIDDNGTYEELHSQEEVDEKSAELLEEWEKLGDEISTLNEQLEELESDDELSDEGENKRDELEKKIEELEEKRDKIESFKDECEKSEIEYDEIYYNTVWRYRDYDPDVDIAQSLGLGVLEFTSGNREGDQWIFLRGCGMDLSPKLMAYQALKFGWIDRGLVRKFRECGVSYIKSCVGEEAFKEMTEKLGIAHCMDACEEDLKKRMAEFEKGLQAAAELMKEDKVLGQLAAVATYFKTQ